MQNSNFKKQLIRSISSSAAIQVASRFLGLAMGIILARALGANGYGIYSYILALITLLTIFSELGLSTYILRKIAAYQVNENWPEMRGLLVRTLQVVLISSLFVIIITYLINVKVDIGLSSTQKETLILALALLPILVVTKVITAAIQSLQHVVKSLILGMLIKPLLVLITLGLIFLFSPQIITPHSVMWLQVIIAFVIMIIAMSMLYRYIPQQVYQTTPHYRTKEWIKAAIPLTVIGGAGVINNQTDILMLGFFGTAENVGLYRVAVQGSILVGFGLQAVNAVVAPLFSRLYAQGELIQLQKIVTISARINLLVALPIALIFIFAGELLASRVFGNDFIQSHTPMAILAVGQLVNAAIGSVGFLLNMTGHAKDVAHTLVITAILNIILNIFLIPFYGMEGAAVATTISLVLKNIILYKIAKKRTGINTMAFISPKIKRLK